jgi:hypothetical protein
MTPRLSVFPESRRRRFSSGCGPDHRQASQAARFAHRARNPKQMEYIMPIHSTLLSWLFGHPQVADHDIRLTTADRQFGRDPDYKSLRWLNGQSPPQVTDGLNRKLLQDIGLDRSRT